MPQLSLGLTSVNRGLRTGAAGLLDISRGHAGVRSTYSTEEAVPLAGRLLGAGPAARWSQKTASQRSAYEQLAVDPRAAPKPRRRRSSPGLLAGSIRAARFRRRSDGRVTDASNPGTDRRGHARRGTVRHLSQAGQSLARPIGLIVVTAAPGNAVWSSYGGSSRAGADQLVIATQSPPRR